MKDLVPADANHIVRTFVQALAQHPQSIEVDGSSDSVAVRVADRILTILGINGLMTMQVPDAPTAIGVASRT